MTPPPRERTIPAHTFVARNLRRAMTPAEAVLWTEVRGRRLVGLKFRRQHPIGGFYADFCCVEHHLVVEVDGPVHLSLAQRDAERTEMLEYHGYRVIRFTNERVMEDLEGVLREIVAACGEGGAR